MMSRSDIEMAMPSAIVWRKGINAGLLGGIVAVFVALEGMLQAFSTRSIVGGLVSMSEALLYITVFATAYLAISRSAVRKPGATLITGGLSGLVTSVLLVALIWLGSVIKLGEVFVNATDQLYQLLTFHQSLAVGSLYWLVIGLGIGVAAAVIHLLPAITRRAVLLGFVAVTTFGLLQELIRVTVSDSAGFVPVLKFLYLTNGLSYEGAVSIFVIAAAVTYIRLSHGSKVRGRLERMPVASQSAMRWSAILLAFVILLLLPSLLGLYLSEVLDQVGLYLLMGLGLNIVVGFAGLLDLGYVAFFAIGAYSVGVLSSPELRTGFIHNWWLTVPFGVAFAVMAGVTLGIPVLKMRGDYLAIVTLGFGEIIRLLALSDFLKPYIGGAQGIQGIPNPNIGPLNLNWGPQQFYYIILAGCLLVAVIAMRLKNSRIGRAWMAIREDEDVAQAMGINLVATKLLAFGMGASFGGLSGAIFASKLASIYPHSFNFIVSVNVLALIIIGGMGSIPGAVVGALALVGLPELLREVGDYRYLFYGALLVVMMLTRPQGLWPEAIRRRELQQSSVEVEPDLALRGTPSA